MSSTIHQKKRQLYKAQERDQVSILLPFRVPMRKLLDRLQRKAMEAVCNGGEIDEIEELLEGDILELLNKLTELAYLKGARRTEIVNDRVIQEPPEEFRPVSFSLGDTGTDKADQIIEYLERVSSINGARKGTFEGQNAAVIGDLTHEAANIIRAKIKELTEAGVHIKGGMQGVAEALRAANVDGVLPHQIEAIFRTQSMLAYNAGRWNQANDSASSYIWGYEYVTVYDPRVREGHRLMEGCRFPKEHKFWTKYFPPNGWNCRCSTLEIWEGDPDAKISFGITGKDPMLRSPKQLEVPDEFIGNVGMSFVEKRDEKPPKRSPEPPATPQPPKGGTSPVHPPVRVPATPEPPVQNPPVPEVPPQSPPNVPKPVPPEVPKEPPKPVPPQGTPPKTVGEAEGEIRKRNPVFDLWFGFAHYIETRDLSSARYIYDVRFTDRGIEIYDGRRKIGALIYYPTKNLGYVDFRQRYGDEVETGEAYAKFAYYALYMRHLCKENEVGLRIAASSQKKVTDLIKAALGILKKIVKKSPKKVPVLKPIPVEEKEAKRLHEIEMAKDPQGRMSCYTRQIFQIRRAIENPVYGSAEDVEPEVVKISLTKDLSKFQFKYGNRRYFETSVCCEGARLMTAIDKRKSYTISRDNIENAIRDVADMVAKKTGKTTASVRFSLTKDAEELIDAVYRNSAKAINGTEKNNITGTFFDGVDFSGDGGTILEEINGKIDAVEPMFYKDTKYSRENCEAWFASIGITTTFDSDLDANVARMAYERIVEVEGVAAARSIFQRAKYDKGFGVLAHCAGAGKGVCSGKVYLSDCCDEKLATARFDSVKRGDSWAQPTPYSTYVHEDTHALHNTIMSRLGIEPFQARMWMADVFKDLYDELRASHGKLLTSYSKKTTFEMIAEARTEVVCLGKEARPFARKVYTRLMKYYKEIVIDGKIPKGIF